MSSFFKSKPAQVLRAGETQEEIEAVASYSKFKRSATIFFGVAAVTLGLAIFVLLNQLSGKSERSTFEASLETQGAQLSSSIIQARDVLVSVSEKMSAAGADSEARERVLASAQEQITSQMWLRVLPTGIDKPEETGEPPLTFAGLELLREAERSGGASRAWVQATGTSYRHVALACPIKDSADVVDSVMYLAMQENQIVQPVSVANTQLAYVELQQSLDRAPLVLSKAGQASLKQGSANGYQSVDSSAWRYVWWYAPPPFLARSSSLIMFLIVASVCVLAGLFMLKQAQRPAIRSKIAAAEYDIATREARAAAAESRNVGLEDQIIVEDEQPATSDGLETPTQENNMSISVPESIFRAYDIRGIVGDTLSTEIVYEIGRSIGSEAAEKGESTVIIARDGRLSGPELSEALANGLIAAGRKVIDIGQVPTPVLYFATHHLSAQTGVMVTGSHNPPDYNGLKMVIAGETIWGDTIQRLRSRIVSGDLVSGKGSLSSQDIVPEYLQRITSDVNVARPLKVVVDCGNGVAGGVAPLLLRELGCDVIEMFCEVDGHFPNHHPDPSKPENIEDLRAKVVELGADLGVAFDGDGDRLGVIDSGGKVIWPDRQMMLYAQDVLSRELGADIIYDVKCSRHLGRVILEAGGRPLMWKTGHSLVKAKIKETGAQLAGEMSGHIFFRERWYGFDDALYTCARLLEILSVDARPSAEIFADLPDSINTPELNVMMENEGDNFRFIEKVMEIANFSSAKVTSIDGLRVDFEDGWGLVRGSNTTPSLVLRFEADDELALQRIQDQFREVMLKVEPEMELPF